MKLFTITSLLILTLISRSALNIFAQDDLESLLDNEMETVKVDETENAAFFTTRVVNGQSLTMMPKNGLDFRVSHHSGLFKDGFDEFYGFDEACTYISFEYGITDWVMASIGHSTLDKSYEGFVKIAALRQSSGSRNMPISLIYYGAMFVDGTVYDDEERNSDFVSRIDYANQLIIGRKFTPRLSLQLSPTYIHRNLVRTPEDNNDVYALGFSGRYRLFKVVSVNVEYFFVEGNESPDYEFYDPFSIGIDCQISRHVFQLYLTNSLPIREHGFIPETTGNFWEGDIRLGFNISTVFTVGGKKNKVQEQIN